MGLLPQPWRLETLALSPLTCQSHRLKKSVQPQSNVVCLVVFWRCDSLGVVPNGRAVDADLYSQQLERVHEILRWSFPALVNRNIVLLQQDNARPHTARSTMTKIQKLGGLELLPHPAYCHGSCAFRIPFASIRTIPSMEEITKIWKLWKWVSPNSSHQKPVTGTAEG